MSNINQLVNESIRSRFKKWTDEADEETEYYRKHPEYARAVNKGQLIGLGAGAVPLAAALHHRISEPNDVVGRAALPVALLGTAIAGIAGKSIAHRQYLKKNKR